MCHAYVDSAAARERDRCLLLTSRLSSALALPATDPLVLWMNGGPGASSVAYGFWTEHGPFRLVPDGKGNYKPSLYDESWNQIANVIYVEAPSGVGFSYSNDTSKYKGITDAESSFDNFLFLQAWFRVFASFKANDFYVTAESYGGHVRFASRVKAVRRRGCCCWCCCWYWCLCLCL